MIYAYAIVLAVATLWIYAAAAKSAVRDEAASNSRRADVLREAARRHHNRPGPLETFRDPRLSPVIFASEPWQLRWWCEKLDVTSDALQAALREVGPMVTDIQIHFARVKRSRARASGAQRYIGCSVGSTSNRRRAAWLSGTKPETTTTAA